ALPGWDDPASFPRVVDMAVAAVAPCATSAPDAPPSPMARDVLAPEHHLGGLEPHAPPRRARVLRQAALGRPPLREARGLRMGLEGAGDECPREPDAGSGVAVHAACHLQG